MRTNQSYKKLPAKAFYCLLILASCSLFLSSCSDWLDVKSDTVAREKNLFENYDGFKEALAGCYTTMASRDAYGEKLTMTDIEDLACLWAEVGSTNLPTQYYLMHHQYDNSYSISAIKSIYSTLYTTIAQANFILNHMEEDGQNITSKDARNVIQGEALAIRAFCHFDVLRLFGQMPKDPSRQVSLPYSYKSSIHEQASYYNYNDFLSRLESDLNEAESLLQQSDPVLKYTFYQLNGSGSDPADLDDDFMMYRRYRLNYWAVKALKARFYLYTGQNSKAYAEAKSVLNAKINGEPVISLSGIHDLDNEYFALPNECLFALHNVSLVNYSVSVLGGNPTAQTGENMHYITQAMFERQLFANQYTASNNRYLTLWNRNAVNMQGIVRPNIRKYYYDARSETSTSAAVGITLYKQCMPLIRLSEIYLILMETTTDLAEANTLYKDYMASHNVNITTDFESLDEVRSLIVDEYRREFYAEGVMFYTYKRNGMSTMLWNADEMTEDEVLELAKERPAIIELLKVCVGLNNSQINSITEMLIALQDDD